MMAPRRPLRVTYGPGPSQFGELCLPSGAGPHPVVVLIHGGFWRARYRLDLMDGLGDDLARRGIASWNIEYRRVGEPGGGWPGTFLDVARAVDQLAGLASHYDLDLARVVTLGHSAGGQLALWLAARPRVPVDAPVGLHATTDGKSNTLPCQISAAVSLAGVVDLADGWRRNLGRGAVADLLGGGPDDVPDRYAAASPAALLPLGVPQALIHGGSDDIVPPALSRAYAGSATAAGDAVRLHELPGVDHFALIDPRSSAWLAIVGELLPLLGTYRH